MAKFNRFDPKNKKKGRNQSISQRKLKIKTAQEQKVPKSLVKSIVRQSVT